MTEAPDPDPRGLIREAYRIESITPAECRTILLDWALGREASADALAALLAHHGPVHPHHPMTALLREGSVAPDRPQRRGGARRRRG